MKDKSLLYLLLLLLIHFSGIGQSYYYKKYGADEGLPTEIIKGVAQDSLGYFWIATDEGLAKYDGLGFTTYTNEINNNYIKGFLQKRNGGLIVFGDLDLMEINALEGNTTFSSVCPISRVPNDSAVSYPKYVYEDLQNSIWISEAESIVKIKNGQLTRYKFGTANRTTQFLRSFSVFEDLAGNLYTSSFQGNVFRYNDSTDSFVAYNINFPSEIEFAQVLDGQLIIGALDGLYGATLSADGGIDIVKKLKDIPSVSYVNRIADKKYLIVTRGSDHFIANDAFDDIKPFPYKINNINHVYVSTENDVWISSNEGLILIKENIFQTVGIQGTFIETVTFDHSKNMVIYATNQNMYEYDPITGVNQEILSLTDGYFQSVVSTSDGIWVANAFKALLFEDGIIKTEFDFSEQGMFVTQITADSNEEIWLTIPGHENAYKIDRNKQLISYPVPLKDEALINIIKSGPNGTYLGASGEESYLYFMARDESAFRNISLPMNLTDQSNIEVTDLAFLGDQLYMASSIGLLKMDSTKVTRVDIGPKYTTLPVRSLVKYLDDKLLLSSSYGLLMYDVESQVVDLFNESYGLPSRTITPNGIMINDHQEVWVCTSEGLSYASITLDKSKKSNPAKIISLAINGTNQPIVHHAEIDYGAFVSFKVASITFPEKDVNYQYRLNEGEWINTGNEINLINLLPGSYTMEVRAQKFGPYTWSDTSSISFEIEKPYWMQFWFIATILMGIVGLMIVTKLIVQSENRISQYRLQVSIREKTRDLKKANDHLHHLNEEKNKLIAIIGHDLRNPLSAVRNLSQLITSDTLEEEDKEFIIEIGTTISSAANRSLSLIEEIIDWGNVTTQSDKYEPIDFADMVNKILDLFSPNINKKSISCKVECNNNPIIESNRFVLELILRNLISNAIKYTPEKGFITICLSKQEQFYRLEVKDSGVGMDEETASKVLQMDSKITKKGTNNEVGTGLGLKLCMDAIERMKGKIEIDSIVGVGTTFRVFIPINEPASQSS